MLVPAAPALAPESAASALRDALGRHAGDLTIADAAARSGLSLRDAELGLHHLSRSHGGHLSVSERGELLFHFPGGLDLRPLRTRGVLRQLVAAGLGLARWTGRAALTLFLLIYSAPLLGALTLFVADLGATDAIRALVGLYADVLYWSVHPLHAPDELGDEPSRQPGPFYAGINNFFLGPPRPRDDPRSLARVLIAEVRAQQGCIALGDVVRVTGLLPEPAGALVSRLLLDHDGHVEVSDDGAIVYRFPALRPSVDQPTSAPPAIWTRTRPPTPLTGNPAATNAPIVAVSGLAAAFGWYGISNAWPIWLAEVPLYGVLVLFAWLLLRVPAHLLARRADRRENARRALLRRIYAAAGLTSGVPQQMLACIWLDETGRMPEPHSFQALLMELGGELILDEQGECSWRFPTLELELVALPRVRASIAASERDVGPVVFSSLPG